MKIQNFAKVGIYTLGLVFAVSCGSSQQTSNSEGNTSKNRGQRGSQNKQAPNAEELFAKMDTNEDGKLSKDEVKGPLANGFSKIDTNNDGFISKKELEKAPKPRQGGRPQRQ
jgi:Ca2+-binding EF-hand superfamily protein